MPMFRATSRSCHVSNHAFMTWPEVVFRDSIWSNAGGSFSTRVLLKGMTSSVSCSFFGAHKTAAQGEVSNRRTTARQRAGSQEKELVEVSKRNTMQLALQQQLDFERKGHLCIRGLLSQAEVVRLRQQLLHLSEKEMLTAYKHRVSVLCPGVDSSTLENVEQAKVTLKQKGRDEVGFLQMFNLHRQSARLKQFTHHPVLCQAAAELLATKRVRLYQDCLFIKLPGFGVTNWHSDLNMVPIDTNSFITFWIPLHKLSPTDSSLHFASGSHRDFALPYWQSNKGMENLERRGYPIDTHEDLSVGDVTIHHGWTLHWAPQQSSGSPSRLAWSVSYFADGARVLCTKHSRRKFHEEDSLSFQAWYKDLKEGQLVHHKLLPLVYS